MQRTYFAACVGAGLFTLLPGRYLGDPAVAPRPGPDVKAQIAMTKTRSDWAGMLALAVPLA